jgi:hypothetical protein
LSFTLDSFSFQIKKKKLLHLAGLGSFQKVFLDWLKDKDQL